MRELDNAMERSAALARGPRVEIEDLPDEVRAALRRPVATSTVRPLTAVEREYIVAVLELNGGNQTRTAAQLEIGSATLYRKLESYGLIVGKKGAVRGMPKTSSRSSLTRLERWSSSRLARH